MCPQFFSDVGIGFVMAPAPMIEARWQVNGLLSSEVCADPAGLQDLDDSWAGQNPWVGGHVAVLLEREKTTRKRQVNFLEREVEQVKRKLAESQATLRQNLVWLSASLEVPSPCAAKLEEAVEIMRSCFDQVRTSKEVDELLQEYAAKDDEHHHKQEVSTDGCSSSFAAYSCSNSSTER